MMDDTTLNEPSFNDCVVPAVQRVTPKGGAWEAAQRSPGRARFLIGAEVLGMDERRQSMGMSYAKSRETFGQPLSERHCVQFILAKSEIEMYATHVMVHESAGGSIWERISSARPV
jgi:alkylation response protein AidB-like acyl-CoA dehydrogenase